MKRLIVFLLLVAMLVIGVGVAAAAPEQSADLTGQQVCPEGDDWVKVDGLNSPTYNYTAPEGKLVNRFCYKAGTSVVFHNVNPAQASVTVKSEVGAGKWGFLCQYFPGNGDYCKDLSHASFRLEMTPQPTPTEPDPTPTDVPVCEDEAASNYGEEGECEYPDPTPTEQEPTDTPAPEVTPTNPPDDRPVCLNYPDWNSLPSGWWRASKDQEPEFTAGFCYGPPPTGGYDAPILFVVALAVGFLFLAMGAIGFKGRRA